MRARLVLAATLLAGSTLSAQAPATDAGAVPRAPGDPEWTAQERAFRTAALNAVFAFRADLHGDSTKVAACRVAEPLQDAAVAERVTAEIRRLLVEPLVPQSHERMRCSVFAFQQNGARVLWLESLVEVRRRGGSESLRARAGPAGGLAFEVTFQLLVGRGYRTFERYEVKPVDMDGRQWRVTRYDLLGQEFIHEHSRSSGPP